MSEYQPNEYHPAEQSPDEIRADIEATRHRLGADVDALAEKVSPSSFAQRQGDRVRAGFKRATDSIMGSADDAGHAVGDAVSSAGHAVGDAVREAPQEAVRRTRGNPLVAGLVAFGVGMLVSSLIPSTRAEREAATAVKEKAQPVLDEAQRMGKELADDLREPAREAVQQVRDTAESGVQHVRDDAEHAGARLQDHARDAQQHVREGDGSASRADYGEPGGLRSQLGRDGGVDPSRPRN